MKLRRVIVVLAACGLAMAIAAVAFRASQYKHALEASVNGETSAAVVARFGQPSSTEVPGRPYLRYAIQGCEAPCARRIWWEHPVLRGIEAWSAEFDKDDRLVHKAHWVSP